MPKMRQTEREKNTLHYYSLGADVIGVNCHFDLNTRLQTIGLMKEALDKEGQPAGYHWPDAASSKFGMACLPEVPLGT